MKVPNDPRLADTTLLCLAAKMALAKRQACGGLPPGWEHGHGLSSLLTMAEQWEREDPWEPTDQELEAEARAGNAMARLLLEARQWQQERGGHGA